MLASASFKAGDLVAELRFIKQDAALRVSAYSARYYRVVETNRRGLRLTAVESGRETTIHASRVVSVTWRPAAKHEVARQALRKVELALRILDDRRRGAPRQWLNEDVAAVIRGCLGGFPQGAQFQTIVDSVKDAEPDIDKYAVQLALQWMVRHRMLVQSGTRKRTVYALPPEG